MPKIIELTKIYFYDIACAHADFINRRAWQPDRNMGGLTLLASCDENSEKQRQNSGPFAVICPAEPSQAQDFRRARAAARCKFLEEQRKTAEVDPEPLWFFFIAQAFESLSTMNPPVSPRVVASLRHSRARTGLSSEICERCETECGDDACATKVVMAGLDPWAFSPRTRSVGIHVPAVCAGDASNRVDTRVKPAHDDLCAIQRDASVLDRSADAW